MTGGPPRQPPRWQWLLSVGVVTASVAGGVASEILAGLVNSSLGSLTWAAAGLAVTGSVAIAVLDVRRSRAREQRAMEPLPAVPAQPSGVPTNLPYTAGFAGREDEVASIVTALSAEHAVAVVGRRGVGTSSCAVEAANRVRSTFPDAQVYLDLRPAGRPMSARDALTVLARTFGTRAPESARAPALVDAAAELHRQLTDRRLLLVLDNVDSVAQVRSLLPPTFRQCRLLLVGTPALSHADGVVATWLTEPDADDAVTMFAAAADAGTSIRLHQQPRTDPAVRDLVELCGRQPRVVRALGYRMARHGWRADDLVARLHHAVVVPAHQRTPLPEPLVLIAEADTAYRALSAAARRLFRLLALAPGALDWPAIRALSGLPGGRVGDLLDELANAAFVRGAPPPGDRYEIRPPLVSMARLHLRRDESPRRRVRAQERLVRNFARQAEHLLSLAAGPDAARRFGPDLYDWFEVNHELLRAVVEGAPGGPTVNAKAPPRRVRRWWFRLAVALCGWYAQEDRLDDWAAVCRAVLATPTAGDRPEIAGWAHNELGALRRRQGDPHGAAAVLTLALAERGRRGTAQARMNLGLALLDLGQVDEAIEHLELARRHQSLSDRSGHALTDLALGVAYLAADRAAPAHHHLVRAANTFHALREARGYAAALTNLVLAQWRLGEYLDAAQSWTAALSEYDGVPDQYGRAAALLNAGAALVSAGPERAAQAYEMLCDARRLREQWRPGPGLGRTLLYLGDAANLLDRPSEAREHWTDAAGVCEAVGDRAGAAAANHRLASEDGSAAPLAQP